MISLHDWPETVKRMMDGGAFLLAGVSAATAMAALNIAAVILSCLAALVSISWGLCRWRDRIKYGPPKND